MKSSESPRASHRTHAEERPDRAELINPRAERVRAVARLAGRSARLRAGAFLVEGPQGCREALLAHLGRGPAIARAQWPTGRVVRELYVSARLARRDPDLQALVDETASLDGPDRPFVRTASAEVLTSMCDAVTGQDIVAVVGLPQQTGLGALPATPTLLPVLCRVQDPGNAGTILRAADAAGAEGIVLTAGSVDVFNPKLVRSTAGSLFHLPLVTGADVSATCQWLREQGVQVWAADGAAKRTLVDVTDAELAAPTAWLFGNEAQGLSEQERGLADASASVPLYGAAESLNVGTAATVCLYASAMAWRR